MGDLFGSLLHATPTTLGGNCFCWSLSLTAMPIAAYPSAADDEAVVVKVVAGRGGSRASGSHGPLDLDPAPCGGEKSGGKGKVSIRVGWNCSNLGSSTALARRARVHTALSLRRPMAGQEPPINEKFPGRGGVSRPHGIKGTRARAGLALLLLCTSFSFIHIAGNIRFVQ
jgi:hypothetical protein